MYQVNSLPHPLFSISDLSSVSVCNFLGNHELWLKTDSDQAKFSNSIQKFDAILEMCDELNVRTTPTKCEVGNIDFCIINLLKTMSQISSSYSFSAAEGQFG